VELIHFNINLSDVDSEGDSEEDDDYIPEDEDTSDEDWEDWTDNEGNFFISQPNRIGKLTIF